MPHDILLKLSYSSPSLFPPSSPLPSPPSHTHTSASYWATKVSSQEILVLSFACKTCHSSFFPMFGLFACAFHETIFDI